MELRGSVLLLQFSVGWLWGATVPLYPLIPAAEYSALVVLLEGVAFMHARESLLLCNLGHIFNRHLGSEYVLILRTRSFLSITCLQTEPLLPKQSGMLDH
jgi:hypothetical protein